MQAEKGNLPYVDIFSQSFKANVKYCHKKGKSACCRRISDLYKIICYIDFMCTDLTYWHNCQINIKKY